MFSPKLLKFAITGAVSVILLVTAVLGASRFQTDDNGSGDGNPAQVVIDELTEIVVQQWCSVCDKRLYPVDVEEYLLWQGKTRDQLESLLGEQYPGASILAFEPGQVVVQFPPVRCAECAGLQWPQRGYIGLTEDNSIAIFCADGSLFRIYGEAPGACMDLLEEGIPFESPEECEQLLVNLTS